MKDVSLKLIFNILKIHTILLMICHFNLKKIKIEKVKKLVANWHDKTEYVIHTRNLKQTLNHWLVYKKVHRVIKFNPFSTNVPQVFFKHFTSKNQLRGLSISGKLVKNALIKKRG